MKFTNTVKIGSYSQVWIGRFKYPARLDTFKLFRRLIGVGLTVIIGRIIYFWCQETRVAQRNEWYLANKNSDLNKVIYSWSETEIIYEKTTASYINS